MEERNVETPFSSSVSLPREVDVSLTMAQMQLNNHISSLSEHILRPKVGQTMCS